MCRLFGFRSVIQSQVHSSLTSAENALMEQSSDHPDGWGVGYYIANAPHIVKSVQTAINDSLFRRVSGIVRSQTVLAHLRKATAGHLANVNTHPFQFGYWIFAHNGNIREFDNIRESILALIDDDLRGYILGNTDSEVIFYLLLSQMRRHGDIQDPDYKIENVAAAIKTCVGEVCRLSGPICEDDNGDPQETFLSFLMTNGRMMLGHQGGKRLFYSTYKTKCGERDSCPFYAAECEAESKTGSINHLVFSSEPIHGENVWIPMQPFEIIGVDGDMNLLDETATNS